MRLKELHNLVVTVECVMGVAKSSRSAERWPMRVVWEKDAGVVHRPVLGTTDG